jgi:transposase
LIDGYFNILFIDESRRSINTELRRVLAPKGSKPIVRINNLRREGVYVYCALNARSGEAFIKIMEKANQYTTMSFLYSLKRHVGRGRIYVVWDNSAAHRSKHVYEKALRKGIHQIYLPKYSPELNVVEEVFRELKMELSNKLFTNLNQLKEEIENFFKNRNYKFNIKINKYIT